MFFLMSYAKNEIDFMKIYITAKALLNNSTNVNNKSLEELDLFIKE